MCACRCYDSTRREDAMALIEFKLFFEIQRNIRMKQRDAINIKRIELNEERG